MRRAPIKFRNHLCTRARSSYNWRRDRHVVVPRGVTRIYCNISINRQKIMFLYSLLAFWCCCYEVKHYIISQGLPSTYWVGVCECAVDFSFLAAGAAVVPTGWPFSSADGQWECKSARTSFSHTGTQNASARMRNAQLRELSCGAHSIKTLSGALGVRACEGE